MPFASSKLGFWNVQQDRAIVRSKNVLIVYDLNSVYGLYGTDPVQWPDPAVISSVIAARETALGLIPTTLSSYAQLLALSDAQLANYAHIWDVGYDTMITAPAAAKMNTYVQSGGAMFFIGENAYFNARNNTISSLVSQVGGGSISVGSSFYQGPATIQPEFLLANPNATVYFNAVNNFGSYGTGTPMVMTGGTVWTVVWKTGSLSNAPTGAICVILDVNWVDGTGNTQQNLIDNISIVLNKA
jgi:hypothetical protein